MKPTVSKIIQKTENTLKISLLFPQDLIFFQGHFDKMTVLPGIAQIDFAIEYACCYLGIKKLDIIGVKNTKFMQLIQPKMILLLSIAIKDKTMCFSFENSEGKKHSSGKLLLR